MRIKYLLILFISALILTVSVTKAQDTNAVYIKSSTGVKLLTIDEDGNVGIGTEDITEKLVVNGNVKASNILSVESFTGWLTNASDFLGLSTTFTVLEFYNNRQNTNTDIFEILPSGALLIKKEGSVSIRASYNCINTTNVYTELQINDIIQAERISDDALGIYDINIGLYWKVNANDEIKILSKPAAISELASGAKSYLTVQWIGTIN